MIVVGDDDSLDRNVNMTQDAQYSESLYFPSDGLDDEDDEDIPCGQTARPDSPEADEGASIDPDVMRHFFGSPKKGQKVSES